jgi:hypothetical protein
MQNESRQTSAARALVFGRHRVPLVSVTLLEQCPARAVQPGPDRPDGAPNYAGGLLVRQFVQLAQHDDLTVTERQRKDASSKPCQVTGSIDVGWRIGFDDKRWSAAVINVVQIESRSM